MGGVKKSCAFPPSRTHGKNTPARIIMNDAVVVKHDDDDDDNDVSVQCAVRCEHTHSPFVDGHQI
jgi:hypothetical protein